MTMKFSIGQEVIFRLGRKRIWRGVVLDRQEAHKELWRKFGAEPAGESILASAERHTPNPIWVKVTHNYILNGSPWRAIANVGKIDCCSASSLEPVSPLELLAKAAE